jgi:LAO/AO transport system kinase
MVFGYIAKVKANGTFEERRNRQLRYWMHETIEDRLRQRFYSTDGMERLLGECEELMLSGRMTSFVAASKAMEYFDKSDGKSNG